MMRAPDPGRDTRAVVFDFGAVLFRWQPLQLLQQVVPELAPDSDTARQLAGRIFQSFDLQSDWAQFDLGHVDEPELADRIARRLGLAVARVRRVIDAIPPHLQAQGPTVEVFRALKAQGHRVYFLSNMPRPYAGHLLRENPFIGEFDDGIFSGDVGLMKPDAAVYALAEQRFGLHAPQTLFIDDHAGNCEAARARGWQAFLFSDAAQLKNRLKDDGWLAGGLQTRS